jgi:hypothetical protein
MRTEVYSPEMTLREARALLFARSGFAPDGGYNDRWVKVQMGRIPFYFPNTRGRRYAVQFHDVHHVLTEYPTNWRGETEIGAWEVSTGLCHHWEGWLLDLLAFAIGLVINPRGVYRAFLRGRRSRNLYGTEWREELLGRRVGELRRALRLDADEGRATAADNRAFCFWATASVFTYFAVGFALLSPLIVGAIVLLWLGGAF